MVEKRHEHKCIKIEFSIRIIFCLLLVAAFTLISIGVKCEGATQNVLIGLGTGCATSFIVSLVFYIKDKLMEKRNCYKNRDIFMSDFKLLLYRTIRSIDFAQVENGEFDLQAYIKKQHRWYHDYCKRMEVNSETEKETEVRLSYLKSFIDSEESFYERALGYNFLWKQSGFKEEQLNDIESIYSLFKGILISIKNSQIYRAFLDFSSLLEEIMKSFDKFDELVSFKLIRYISFDGLITINYDEFVKQEPMLKFLREFSKIREENYLKKYWDSNQK